MKKKILFVAAIIALVTISSYGQARKYYKAGQDFIEGKRYEDAVAQFTIAISVEPAKTDYYYARGQAYELLLKYPEARADYEKVLVFDPKNVDALISLGTLCNKTGKYDDALKLLNHASALEIRNSKVYPEKVITLINLKRFDRALQASDTAIIIKETPMDYFYRGVIFKDLNNNFSAKRELNKAIQKDKTLAAPRLLLAQILLLESDTQGAMAQVNEVLKNDERNTEAYLIRSNIYKKKLDYPSAINDISKDILIDPGNPDFYYARGISYQEFNQHTNAISDFSKYISMRDSSADGYSARAKSYEETQNWDKAIEDYAKIALLFKYNSEYRELLENAQKRLYVLNKEADAPEISVVSPVAVNDTILVKGDKTEILITGKIKDKSKIKSFTINDKEVILVQKKGEYEFLTSVDIIGANKLSVVAIDDYDNKNNVNFTLSRTEINNPKVTIVSPYTSEGGEVFLDSQTPNISIQGRIADESRIKSIKVGDITAAYNDQELNPVFTAPLNVANINKFNVVAEDIYGNKVTTEFVLNREGGDISASNPMGKTWVVFIENSGYKFWPALDGAIKDVNTIRAALANYQIHNIIHLKDMTKKQMEDYFTIDLRNLVRENQVKSLLVWYAGHGKYLNDAGYWIPVDAERDNEYTYFNIGTLKNGLLTYSSLVHTLVVSDACESGPGFYTAMRSAPEIPTCSNTMATGSKSAQVFSSTGYSSGSLEKASDNSKFTKTFADKLIQNSNACIPIETIVDEVTKVVKTDKGQKPKFGNIQGMEEMGGTFFFIKK
jgi:tetratricopeptide (TPR) repeat protein